MSRCALRVGLSCASVLFKLSSGSRRERGGRNCNLTRHRRAADIANKNGLELHGFVHSLFNRERRLTIQRGPTVAKVTILNRPPGLNASRCLKGSFSPGAMTSTQYKTPSGPSDDARCTELTCRRKPQGRVSSCPACHVHTRGRRMEGAPAGGKERHHIQGRYLCLKTGERQLFHTFAFISTFSPFREPRTAAPLSTLGHG